jgi:2-amino-4-hydroxy-6-hydroxymethyldihydropteridine diphosphokinase
MRTGNPVIAHIGLGANVGDRARNIYTAAALLSQTPGVTLARLSTLLENPSVGGAADAGMFLNAAAEIATTLPAPALLQSLMEIERRLGRQRREKWEPRTIDLDLLLYGTSIVSTQALMVPHPLMHERMFVLAPLAEIAAEAVHPILQMTVGGLLENLRNPPESAGNAPGRAM